MKEKEYSFSYKFEGKSWSTSVFAKSKQEAMEKIKAQSNAVFDGEIVSRVYVPYPSKPINLPTSIKRIISRCVGFFYPKKD